MNPTVTDPVIAHPALPSTDISLPFGFAKRFEILLTRKDDGVLLVHGPGTPTSALLEVTRRLSPLAFKVVTVESEEFNSMLQQSYEAHSDQTMQMMEGLEEDNDLQSVAEQLPEPEDLLESDDDAPIIRLINALLTRAIRENASDIHVEPFENNLVVRIRVDGVLQEVLRSRRAVAPLVVSRIKVMAKLDIAEKRLPQDGRISLRIAGRAVDVRVSTVPSGHGERVVLRLLDKQAGRLDLEHLGMEEDSRHVMDEIIHKPHGIILVTGPTGSGKTTTLYAALSRINNRSRNILTVEDPIEYYIEGIGQMQVNTKVDMTFARGLRAILRQDPDVVMVGEIRDLETAEIAVQASLTGHLVLSTLHTNTAVGAITRLRDMGVEPFLLSSSLVAVIAQRLVRLLCTECKTITPATSKEIEILGVEKKSGLSRAVGCEKCNKAGYQGRTGIYELVAIDNEMRGLIHDGAGEQELENHARKHSPGIRSDGRRLVQAGLTTVEEVLRVTRED